MTSLHKKVLNVGGFDKELQIPSCFDGWQHDLLDIDPVANPDILCDAREIWKLPPRQYDAVYCSHNLEHFHWHDVQKVLKGFRLILKKEGFAYIRVPNLIEVMQKVVEDNLDLCDQLYMAVGGPISPLDVIYGWEKQIESSGEDFFCHKTGFSSASLVRQLKESGFQYIYLKKRFLEISAIAFTQKPDFDVNELFEDDNQDFYQPQKMEKGSILQRDAIEAASLMQRGRHQFEANNLDGAEVCFEDALSGLNKLLSQTLLCLAKIACNRSEFAKALNYLARTIEVDPTITDAYALTAEIYFTLNETKLAKEWCEKTLQINRYCLIVHKILSRINLPGPDYLINIEMIQKHLRPRTYLEIGVAFGKTLKFAADYTMAIGVDPSPVVDVPLGRMTRVYEKTSDDFFKQVDLEKEFDGLPVDLAFIDGMHLFEFALRDFINIEKYCTDQSVILVHDCCPLDDITAARERVSEFWSGDIWKLIVCLKKYRPDLCINVIETAPTGLAIITGLNKQSRILAENLDAIYEEFIDIGYGYLDQDKVGKLNLVPNEWSLIKAFLDNARGG